MIKVLVVEDHPIVREGVMTVLERERDIKVVGAAETAREGLRLAAALRPDVVLLDLKLPDTDEFDGVASFARWAVSLMDRDADVAEKDLAKCRHDSSTTQTGVALPNS